MEAHNDSVYRKTIFQALDFAWHHKRLWFLGVFAGLVNSGGVFEVLVRGLRDVMGDQLTWNTVADTIAPGGSVLFLLRDIIAERHVSNGSALVLWLIITGMIFCAFWFFSLAQGTLLAAVNSPGDTSITKRTYDELPLAGRLVGVNLVTHLALASILVVTFYPYANAVDTIGKAAASGLGFIIATPLTVFVTVTSILTACGIALHRERAMVAFKNAFKTFKKQPFLLAEAALVLFVLSAVFVFGVVIALRLLTLVFSLYGFLTFIVSLSGLGTILTVFFLVLSLVAILAAFGFLVTFQYAAWAALYERLLLGTAVAAFHRHVLHPLKAKVSR
jgi:hypothetical protein